MMKSTGSVIAALMIFLASCSPAGNDTRLHKEKAGYEETKKALLEKERNNPAMFLTVTGNDKKNLIGQTVIKGVISNSASVAKYKDVEIKLNFYSKTKTLLDSDRETIYIELNPGVSERFKSKYFAPKGTDSIALSVLSAKVISQ